MVSDLSLKGQTISVTMGLSDRDKPETDDFVLLLMDVIILASINFQSWSLNVSRLEFATMVLNI